MRGLNAVYVKQIASWVFFLAADEKNKNWERRRMQMKQLSLISLLKVSFLVGIVNTGANMPFDVVKTNLQKDRYLDNKSVFKTMLKIYRNHGVSAIYAGWQVRMLQYMIQSVFTVTILDRLESSWRK